MPAFALRLLFRMAKPLIGHLPKATPPPRLRFPFSYSSNDLLDGRRECLEIGESKRRRVWLTPNDLSGPDPEGKSYIVRSAYPSFSEYPASFSYRNASICRWPEVVEQDELSDVSMEDNSSLASVDFEVNDLIESDDAISIASGDSLAYSVDSELFGELIPVDDTEELGSCWVGNVRRSCRLSRKPIVSYSYSYSCYINADDNYDRDDDPDYYP